MQYDRFNRFGSSPSQPVVILGTTSGQQGRVAAMVANATCVPGPRLTNTVFVGECASATVNYRLYEGAAK